MEISKHALLRIRERIGLDELGNLEKRIKNHIMRTYVGEDVVYIVTAHGELPNTIKIARRVKKGTKAREEGTIDYLQKTAWVLSKTGVLITAYSIHKLYSQKKLQQKQLKRCDKNYGLKYLKMKPFTDLSEING